MAAMLVLLVAMATVMGSEVIAGSICCIPDQMEGAIFVQEGNAEGSHQDYAEVLAKWSYDFTHQQQAMEISDNKGDLTKLIIISGTQYSIDLNKKTCSKIPATPFPRTCIPETATKLWSQFYGIADDTLSSVTYRYAGVHQFSTVTSVTKKNCVYITSVQSKLSQGVLTVAINSHTNDTMGIKDPSVFTPPSYCP